MPDRPDDPREFVGAGDGGFIEAAPVGDGDGPLVEGCARGAGALPTVAGEHHAARPVRQEVA